MSTRPPSCENLTAFDKRLSRICLIARSSPQTEISSSGSVATRVSLRFFARSLTMRTASPINGCTLTLSRANSSLPASILDMSKIEAGKLELARESVRVQPLIGEAVRMVSERAKNRKLTLVATLPDEEISVWGDERAIKQILLNLLSNAVKFSHEGGRVDIRASFDDAGDLVLEVEDYGIGMAENEITRALEPFGQARPAVTKTHGGTGLGLPIAKGLTEAHGGKLFVESTPREGTRVRILLPQQSASPDDAQDVLATIGAERAVA